jgi:regulatory protein
MHRRTLTSAQQRRAVALPRRTTAASPSLLVLPLPFPETRCCCRSSAIARARRRASDFEPEAPPEPGAEEQPPSKTTRRRKARADDADADANVFDANEATTSTPTTTAALRKAVSLVDYRERSSGELLRRLASFPESDARQAVERLEASGLVDDRRFADLLVARRWRFRAEAPRAIRQALQAAGVPREVGEEALEAFFGGDVRVVRPFGGGEEEDEEDDEDGARSRWRALVAAAREQARRSESADPEKRRARLYRWLASRGHSYDTVSALVREVGL